ncbi:hypothetical protein PN836_005700 [Ningiella sp. W23]|uniref:hypothetical protein n=1 Tax=Ningiella sp. W23 TaxID=3023715 RepID=UPI003756F105
MSIANTFIKLFFAGLLITQSINGSYANVGAEYSTLEGEVYSFEDNATIIRMNTSYVKVLRCNFGQFCIEFDDTRISIPSNKVLDSVETNSLFKHHAFSDKRYVQVLELKEMRFFNQEFKGYLIKTFKHLGKEQTEIDSFFYSKDVGVVFFEYLTRELDFKTGGFELNRTPVFLKGTSGLRP